VTTIYLHRAVAHGSVRFAPWLDNLLNTLQVLLTGVRPRQWSAVHLYHHVFVDDSGDPHSPHLEGLWHVIFFTVHYYKKAADNPLVWAHPVIQRRLAAIPERRSDQIGGRGPGLVVIAMILLFGWQGGLLIGLIYLLPFTLLLGAVNAIAHVRGYKNFQCAPAFNVPLLALLTGGEGLHNNHHARFTSPFFAHRPVEWMFDTGGVCIWVMCALKLAQVDSPKIRANLAP